MRKTSKSFLLWVLFFMGSAELMYASGLVWEQTRIERDAKVNEESIDVVFPFVVEDRPVTIKSIRNSCGCTTSRLTKDTYTPGESGEIQVHFSIGTRIGEQHKFISLETDDPENPTVQLELVVYIPQIVKFEPRFLYWTKGEEPFGPQTTQLKIDADIPIRIKSVTSDQGQLQVSWEKTGEKLYTITFTPIIPEGEEPFFRAIVKVEVDADEPLKQKAFFAYAYVKSS